MRLLRRSWPLLLVLLAAGAAYAFGLGRFLSFDALGRARTALEADVAAHPVLAPAAFVLFYALVAALAVPGAVVLTVAGGLLFGTLVGGALVVLGASIGAVALFLAARHALGPVLARKGGQRLAKLRAGLERDGFSYLLALRLVPLVPFWLLNLAPALAGMRLGPFAAATVLGIVPGTLVFASVGAGLGGVLAEGGTPGMSLLLRPAVLLPLLGLAVLALLPVAWRRWKGSDA